MTDIETDEPYEVSWRVTRELQPEDIHCDLCGEQADSMHFVPYVIDCKAVVFACPDHNPVPDGYSIELKRWYGPEAELDFPDHIAEKGSRGNGDGVYALAILSEREFEIRCRLAKPD